MQNRAAQRTRWLLRSCDAKLGEFEACLAILSQIAWPNALIAVIDEIRLRASAGDSVVGLVRTPAAPWTQ